MIKEIKTEKFEGLAVLVPEWYVSSFANMGYLVIQVMNEKTFIGEDEMFPPDRLERALERVSKLPEYITLPAIKLPDGEYKILGKATELTEEQCAEIVSQMKDSTYPFEVEEYKVTFENLMHSLECYSVNPCGDKSSFLDMKAFEKVDAWLERAKKWQDAQENTGTWLILKKEAGR